VHTLPPLAAVAAVAVAVAVVAMTNKTSHPPINKTNRLELAGVRAAACARSAKPPSGLNAGACSGATTQWTVFRKPCPCWFLM
jgi:hypothetical protein